MNGNVRITADTTIDALLAAVPAAAAVFVRRRMHCVGCEVAAFETIADVSRNYGQPLAAVLQELRTAASGAAGRAHDRGTCFRRRSGLSGRRVMAGTVCDVARRGEEKMPSVTQPLRDEHKELLPHVETLRTAADAVGAAPNDSWRAGVDEAYAFLAHHLVPHAQAEERALYPVVEKVLGALGATDTMKRDHVEVRRLTEELAALRSQLPAATPSGPQVKALHRVLYGLYTLVKVHFAKEEEVYLPLLDARLTPAEAERMFAAMEAAAREAKATAH